MTRERLQEYYKQEERQEALEHRDVLLAIAAIIKRPEGIKLFGYLFKYFDVVQLPEDHLKGKELFERIGVLKAGNAIYKLACEADSIEAASLLSKLEREKYDKLCERYRIEQGIDDEGRGNEGREQD